MKIGHPALLIRPPEIARHLEGGATDLPPTGTNRQPGGIGLEVGLEGLQRRGIALQPQAAFPEHEVGHHRGILQRAVHVQRAVQSAGDLLNTGQHPRQPSQTGNVEIGGCRQRPRRRLPLECRPMQRGVVDPPAALALQRHQRGIDAQFFQIHPFPMNAQGRLGFKRPLGRRVDGRGQKQIVDRALERTGRGRHRSHQVEPCLDGPAGRGEIGQDAL